MAHEPPKMASTNIKPNFGNSYPNVFLEHIINQLIVFGGQGDLDP